MTSSCTLAPAGCQFQMKKSKATWFPYHRGWWGVCMGLESARTMWCRGIDRQTQVGSRCRRFQSIWFKLDLECVPATSGERTACCFRSVLWLESCTSCDRWEILHIWSVDLDHLPLARGDLVWWTNSYCVYMYTSCVPRVWVSQCLLQMPSSSQAKCVCLGKIRLWTTGPWN